MPFFLNGTLKVRYHKASFRNVEPASGYRLA